MKMRNLEALCESTMPEWPISESGARQRILGHVVPIVIGQISLAPAHIRIGLCVVGIAFGASARLAAGGRGLARLDPAARGRIAERLAGTVPWFRAYLQLVGALTALAYMEHPLVLDALGLEEGTSHQRRFRAARRNALPKEEADPA